MSIVARAEEFAKIAHGSQRRKYTGEPYWYHLSNVASLVECVEHDDEMLAAAWLHDVLEDTKTRPDDLLKQFGADVTVLVSWLTNRSIPEDGNRAKRKEIDRLFLEAAPARAKTIKLADLIDNTESIVAHDPDFGFVYLNEKAALLPGLTDGDPRLMFVAQMTLKNGFRRLKRSAGKALPGV